MAKRLEQLQYMLEASPNEPFLIFAIAKEFEKFRGGTTTLYPINHRSSGLCRDLLPLRKTLRNIRKSGVSYRDL